MVRRWKCSVCGYLHEGPEPPATCPVCGADRSQFVPFETIEPGLLREIITTFKLHPVAAHFPAGLLPTAALFLTISVATGHAGLATAAYWLILVATAVVPVSIASGLRDWRRAFGGRGAPIISKKISLAVALFLFGLAAIALRHGDPGLPAAGGWQGWLYLVVAGGMVGCVMLLGHYGTILAARGADRQADVRLPAAGETPAEWPQLIVAHAADAILAADATGTIRLWNAGAERIFGVAADKAIGQSLDLIILDNLRQRHWEGWGKVMQSGESRYGTEMLRVPALRGDGSRFSAEFSIVMLKDAAGKVTGVAAILRDVTVQWEREKELQAQLTAARGTPSA